MGVYKADRKGLEAMVCDESLMGDLLQSSAEIVAETARATAPYDETSKNPEHFKDSIKTRTEIDYVLSKTGQSHRTLAGVVYSDDPVGAYIEIGTRHTPAHNTLDMALDSLSGASRKARR